MCNKLGLKKRSEIYLYDNELSDSKSNRRKLINYRKSKPHSVHGSPRTSESNNKYHLCVYSYLRSIDDRITKSNLTKMAFGRKLLNYTIATDPRNEGYWEGYKYFM